MVNELPDEKLLEYLEYVSDIVVDPAIIREKDDNIRSFGLRPNAVKNSLLRDDMIVYASVCLGRDEGDTGIM